MGLLAPMAGVGDLWSGFIRKATDIAINARFHSDKDAIAAIPKEEERIGWKGWIIGVFLIGVAIIGGGHLFSYVEDLVSTLFNKVVSIADSSDTLKNTHDEKTVLVSSEMDEEWTEQAKVYIDDILSDLILSQYGERYFPLCRQFSETPPGKERLALGERMDTVKDNMIDGIIEYANELKDRFPSLSVYIANKTYDILEEQQLKAEKMKHK